MTAVTEENTIADTLDGVAEVLKTQGWIAGPDGMLADTGPKCLLGAFGQVLGADTEQRSLGREEPRRYYSYHELNDSSAVTYFAATLGIYPPLIPLDDEPTLATLLWAWNDAIGRVAEDVLQRIEAAAHLARQANLSLLDVDTDRLEYAAAHLRHEAPA